MLTDFYSTFTKNVNKKVVENTDYVGEHLFFAIASAYRDVFLREKLAKANIS
jgi:hypothetical protein